jgi:hypothetical protein
MAKTNVRQHRFGSRAREPKARILLTQAIFTQQSCEPSSHGGFTHQTTALQGFYNSYNME